MKTIFDMNPPFELIDRGDGFSDFGITGMPIDGDAAELPIRFPSFPAVFLAPLGAIIVQWGEFEQLHDRLIRSLESSLSLKLKGGTFQKKRESLEILIDNQFEYFPNLKCYLSSIIEDSARIYPQRNALAHGHLFTNVNVQKPEGEFLSEKHILVRIESKSHRKNNDGVYVFSMIELKAIFYRIAHLCGKIANLLDGSITELNQEEIKLLSKIIKYNTDTH